MALDRSKVRRILGYPPRNRGFDPTEAYFDSEMDRIDAATLAGDTADQTEINAGIAIVEDAETRLVALLDLAGVTRDGKTDLDPQNAEDAIKDYGRRGRDRIAARIGNKPPYQRDIFAGGSGGYSSGGNSLVYG